MTVRMLLQKWRRLLLPRAITVVILGPDGSGKSTVARECMLALQSTFPKVEYIHWRPGILKRRAESGPVTNPHGQRPRSAIISVAKLLFLLLDFNLGGATRMFRGSGLVLFDRYYHDLLVDPKRYRYGGPMWLARWIGKLVPQPDLWVLLDAMPEVLHSRKQEVSIEETARQRGAYLQLVRNMMNAVVVDASQPIADVVHKVNTRILDLMAAIAAKRPDLSSDSRQNAQ